MHFKLLAIVMLLYCFCSRADITLNQRLQRLDLSLTGEVRADLVNYATRNHLLNHVQLNQAAALSAEHQQWTHAGFYLLAADMRQKIDSHVFKIKAPLAVTKMTEGHFDQQLLKNLSFDMYHDPIYQYVLDAGELTTDIKLNNQLIRLYLLQHLEVLKEAFTLYITWRPAYGAGHVPVVPSEVRLLGDEVEQVFETLNYDYTLYHQKLLSLLEIPDYRRLKVKRQQIYMSWVEKMLSDGNTHHYNEVREELMQLRNDMFRIEIEQQTYPDLDWGWSR